MVRFRSLTRHEQHPPLADLKALAARLLAARNLRIRAAGAGGPRSEIIEDLWRQVETLAQSHSARDEGVPLSAFLSKVRAEVKRIFRECPTADRSDPMGCGRATRRALAGFILDTRGIDCAACAGQLPGGKACDGTANDACNLGHRPHCLEPLATLFEWLVERAQESYGPVLAGSGDPTLDIRLETYRTAAEGLAARTEFPTHDRPEARVAHILVDLPVSTFDDKHLRRLPYMLFHEVFVHAAESWLAGGRRQPTGERCALREGFVDAAALEILRTRLDGDAAVALPAWHADFAETFAMAAEAAHLERADLGGGSSGGVRSDAEKAKRDVVARRNDGVMLFKRVVRACKPHAAVQLALCLNVLPLDQPGRIQLMNRLIAATDRPKSGVRAPCQNPFQPWFRQLATAAAAHDVTSVRRLVEPVAAAGEFGA